jgi:hypothetical protein
MHHLASILAIILIASVVCIFAFAATRVSHFASRPIGAACYGIFTSCDQGHCCYDQGCGAAHWTCQEDCNHNQLCGNTPVGAACSSNGDCANGACGRAGAGGALTCCASGAIDTYAGYDYCTKLPPGTPCWSDAMCGDGSAGMCSGTLGLTAGVCGSQESQYCTSMYNSCISAAQNATIASNQGVGDMTAGNAQAVGEGAGELTGYYALAAKCKQQVTVCQQNGGTWGPLTYPPVAPPAPPPAAAITPPNEQPLAWGGLTSGGDPTAGPGGIPLGAMFA